MMKTRAHRKKKQKKTIPQVAILLESSHGVSRGMMRGILDYVRIYGPWALHMIAGGANDQRMPDLKSWKGNGIIARIPNPASADDIVQANLPTVLVDPFDRYLEKNHPLTKCPRVQCNSVAVAGMAAKHLITQGFTNFAYVGDPNGFNWSRWREKAFTQRLTENHFSCHIYSRPETDDAANWSLEIKHMCRWLKKLPKPTAVFAANDARGRQVLNACLSAGIAVPYEIAVLAVNNDVLICETSLPPLSSVAVDMEQAGHKAAEMLDKLMCNEKLDKPHIRYGPEYIVNRASSQRLQVNDRLVIEALEFIRINSGLNIRVIDVADHLRVSSRWLEKLFAQHLGRSVIKEIHRVRSRTIYNLVTRTGMPFAKIAERCGFTSSNHLGVLFRKEFGETMSNARNRE
ncbi:MAG: XylR family transcriptional regulator [Kiritimatiellia bacterium]